MTSSLHQLAALRHIREQQAMAALQRQTARLRDRQAELERLRTEEEQTRVQSAQRIARLYGHCVDSPLSPSELDMLMMAVDRQYILRAEARAAVEIAEKTLVEIATEVEEARRQLAECRRNVEKLDLVIEEIRHSANRRAEVIAESEAERPPADRFLATAFACS